MKRFKAGARGYTVTIRREQTNKRNSRPNKHCIV